MQLGRTSYVPEPLDLAVAPNGAAVVAWNDGSHIRAARRPAGRCPRSSPRACFGPEQNLGERCPSKLHFCIDSPRSLAVTIGPRGRPSVAWTAVHHNGELYASVIRFARGRGESRFTGPRTISHGAEPSVEPTLHDGSVVAAWSEIPTHYSARIVAAVLDEHGRRSPLRTLSIKGCREPRASVSPDDEVTLAWRCRARDYDERRIFLAIRPAGADFGPQLPIAPGDAVEPVVVIDAHGTSFIFYTSDGIHVRIRPPGQELGVDRRIAAGGYPHVVAAGERVTTFIRSADNRTAMRDWIRE